MPRPVLSLLLLAALLCGAAQAESKDNLRGLTAADLCPPTAFVYLDDEEQTDMAADVDAALEKYATLYSLPYGDPKTCTVNQTFVVDSFKSRSGKYVYSAAFTLETRREAAVILPMPQTKMPPATPPSKTERRLTLEYVTLWSDRGYGLLNSADEIGDMAVQEVRDYYENFALAWKATHKR